MPHKIDIRSVACPTCGSVAELAERQEFAWAGQLLRRRPIAFSCPAGCDVADRTLERLVTATR